MRARKVAGGIVLTVAGVVLLAFIWFKGNSVSVNTMFAEKIILEVEPYTYAGEAREGFAAEINQDDMAVLKKIFNRTAIKDTPACPCGGVNVIFSSGNQSLTLYPAGDDCDTVRVSRSGQDYYFHLGDENNAAMREILKKYGVVWPYGI